MGFDTNGNWTSDFYPETDRDEHLPISASKFQQLIQTDIKGGFDNCLTRDGAGKPEANLNFNGHKITNLANGEAPTDAITKQQLDSAVGTPASESEAGTIQIATSAEALAATNDTKAMTPKKVGEVVRTLSTITPFCANSGNLDANGDADLISAVGGTISFKVDDGTIYKPLVCTPANSQNSFTLQSIDNYDASALADGTYVLTTDNEGTITAYPYQTGYFTYTRKTAPSTPYLWFDVSKEPYNAYKYEGGSWVEFSGVPLAIITMASGSISSFENLPYNENGFKATIPNVFDAFNLDYASKIALTISTSGDTYTAPCDGLIVWVQNSTSSSGITLTIGSVEYKVGDGDTTNQDWHCVQGKISKGETATFVWWGGINSKSITFIPFKGAIKGALQ